MNGRLMCGRMKEKLDRGEFCRGVHIPSSDLSFYEIAALADMDYVWIDTEHAAADRAVVRDGMMVLQARGISAIVRVPKCDAVLAKPFLDNGADGIVFPMVNSADEAAIAVAACRYPPQGTRGYGPLRASDFGMLPAGEQIAFANRQVMPIIQIEHHLAVERLDSILDVEGVAYAVIGPMDLSLSVGKPGQLDDPEVRQMLETIFAKCRSRGVKLGLSMGLDRALYDYGVANGALFISAGNPYAFFLKGMREWMPEVRGGERSEGE